MISSLLAALLASVSAQDPTTSWLDRLAPHSARLIHIGDIGSALASEDPGAWLDLLRSPDMRDALDRVLDGLGMEGKELMARHSAEDMRALLAGLHGGVVAFPEFSGTQALAVLSVDESFLDQLLIRLNAAGWRCTPGECGGRACHSVSIDSLPNEALPPASAHVAAIVQEPARVLIAFGDADRCERTLERYLPPLSSDADYNEGWWQRCKERVADPMIEGFLDISAFDMGGMEGPSPEMYVDLAYVGFSFGRAGTCGLKASVLAGPDEDFFDVREACQPVDRSFFRVAPKGLDAAAFLNIDFGKLAESMVNLLWGLDETIGETAEGALGAASVAMGADLVDEIFPALTGDVVFMSWAPTFITAEGDFDYTDSQTCGAFGVRDSEVLIEALEVIETLAGLEYSEDGDWAVWRQPSTGGPPMEVRLSETRLLFGPVARVAELAEHITNPDSASLVEESDIASLNEREWATVGKKAAFFDEIASGLRQATASSGPEPDWPWLAPLRDLFLGGMHPSGAAENAKPISTMTINANGAFIEYAFK